MSIWLQLVAALSSAVVTAVMGVAYIPFLRKLRFFEPMEDADKEETAGEKLRPTMCGALLIFGSTLSLVLCWALYLNFAGADRTDSHFQEEVRQLQCLFAYAFLMGLLGLTADILAVRSHFRYRMKPFWKMLCVFLVACGLQLAGMEVLGTAHKGLWILPSAGLLVLCYCLMQTTEKAVDGVGITAGCVLFGCLTVVNLLQSRELPALYSLIAAGACMGCMVWNLAPAKCRLGSVGTCWLGGLLPALCPDTRTLCLCMAVYVLDALPSLGKEHKTLLERIDTDHPWKKLTVILGFSAFCGVIAVFLARS